MGNDIRLIDSIKITVSEKREKSNGKATGVVSEQGSGGSSDF